MSGGLHSRRLGTGKAPRAMVFSAWITTVMAACFLQNNALAEDDQKAEPLIRSIQDNSFLLEEAYNQEEGVVQNIQEFTH